MGTGNSSWKYDNESRWTCRVGNCIWEEFNITNIQIASGNIATQRCLPVYQHHQRTDCQSKISSSNQVCSLIGKNFEFFGKTLSTTDIMPACCYEKDLQFSQEIWAARVHNSSENYVCLIFLQFPGWKWKICKGQSRLTFSSHGFAAWIKTCGYTAHWCSNVSLFTGCETLCSSLCYPFSPLM